MQLVLSAIHDRIPATRPLVPIEAAMVLLDRDEDEILHAVESGALGWAWDIATPGAERREVRIWRDSLLALIAGEREPAREWGHVQAMVLPPGDIKTPALCRLFSCGSTHVHALARAALHVVRGPDAPSGPRAYSVISRASVSEFLRSRRVL